MIDVEIIVANHVLNKVRTRFPTIPLGTNALISAPTTPQSLHVFEISNTVYTRSQDSEVERHANIGIQIEAYDNSANRRTVVKQIMALADEAMAEINFTRIMLENIPNTAQQQRIVARYRAVVGKDGLVYRQ